MSDINFTSYSSPFSWRYGSPEMRHIFSEENKYRLWRKIWVALAQAQHVARLVTRKELQDLKKNEENIDISRILEIEKETKHDVVAAIKEYAEKATVGGRKIHLGATSMDVVDNADMLRMKEALQLTQKSVQNILAIFTRQIEKYIDIPCMGFTHLQPAEPTTVGYRLAFYAQDLLMDLDMFDFILAQMKTKGMKGAVGTSASYAEVLQGTKLSAGKLDTLVMRELDLISLDITNQVYPRKLDYLILTSFASAAISIAKFAEDLRILQSPPIGEWSEPFSKKQVGSSAMPFKKNPISSEKICSLARYIKVLPQVAWDNAVLSHLERTLDDSANKRLIISETFLAFDEILRTVEKIISGLVINTDRISYNLNQYGAFAATESIIIAAVKKGANRQEVHEVLREVSLKAWGKIHAGEENPMSHLLQENDYIKKYLNARELEKLFEVSHHIGDAPQRARKLVKKIKKRINEK